MQKKLAGILGIFALVALGFAFLRMYDAGRVPASDENDVSVRTSAALASAGRMERLCCGTASGSDISMERSAFCTDFVPREPEYVERFRHYNGPEADFVPVLMYHFFYDADTELPKKGNNSHSIQSVRTQLQWLWKNGYVTLSMDELYEWLEGNIRIPARCVVITSDDGQENFFDLLQPELHRYGFVATSFVITAWRKNIPYKKTLPNIELHCHTHNMHRGTVREGGVPGNRGMMQGVSVEYGVNDLKQSLEILGDSKYFAYPYGTYGGNSKEILRQTGFRLAFTTASGMVRRGNDPLQLPRRRVEGSLDLEHFEKLLRARLQMQK